MDLSELDGFLAGLIVGPELIPPSEWLPVVWNGEEPDFITEAEAEAVLGAIMRRYDDIAASLDGDVSTYMPIFWEHDDGTPIVEDWAYGFMHAVSLRTEAWDAVLRDEDSAILLIPIGIIASQVAAVEDDNDDMVLPDEALDELMRDSDTTMIASVIGLHRFWRDRMVPPVTRH